jgi:hypothetical protein
MRSGAREESGGAWFLREDYLAPVNVFTLASIYNNSDEFTSIHEFSYAFWDKSSQRWVDLVPITSPGKLYCCIIDRKDLNQLHEVNLDEGGMYRALQSGPLAPHKTLTNWFMFEFPIGYVSNNDEATRILYIDDRGRKYERQYPPISAIKAKNGDPVSRDVREELDRLTLKTLTNPITNLSWIRVSHVADEEDKLRNLRSKPR